MAPWELGGPLELQERGIWSLWPPPPVPLLPTCLGPVPTCLCTCMGLSILILSHLALRLTSFLSVSGGPTPQGLTLASFLPVPLPASPFLLLNFF